MEIWKEIKGFEDYEVSSLGRVKSLARTITHKDGKVYKHKSKILKLKTGSHGYLAVNIFKDTKPKTRNKRDKKWKSTIRINGKKTHLGNFNDELKAAKAYQIALAKLVK